MQLLILALMLLVSSPAYAAITYVGGQTGSFLGTTSAQTINFALTGGLAAVPATGDLIIVSYAVGTTSDLTFIIKTPAGANYTLFGTELHVAESADTNLRVAYLVASGTPETQVELSETVTGGTASIDNGGAYSIHVFRGVHATPLEQAVQQGTAINTQTVDPGSITPTTAGTVIYVVGGAGLNTTGGVYTSSDLTAFLSSTIGDVRDAQVGAGYFAWTSGAFSPATFGGGGASDVQNGHAWMIVALAPAAGGGATCNGGLTLLGVGGC